MINDRISNSGKYNAVNADFAKVFAFLAGIDGSTALGRYDISDTAYVNVAEGDTVPRSEGRFEVHDIYADIQYMICGREVIDVCDAEGLFVTGDNPAGDIKFLAEPADYAQAYLGEGWFAVLFPGEAHRPMTAPDGIPMHVKKAVAKIKIN